MTAAEEWGARYRAGATLRQIAAEAGVAPKLVSEVLRDAGEPMRRKCPDNAWYAKVPPLRAEGLTCGQIGARLGKHRNTVERVVRRLGLRS